MRADPGAPGRFGAAWLAKVRRDGRWRMHAVLGAILGALLLATSLATAALWPDAEQVPIHGAADAAGSEIITVRVTDVVPIPCAQADPAPTARVSRRPPRSHLRATASKCGQPCRSGSP